jgi:hypothetical protein
LAAPAPATGYWTLSIDSVSNYDLPLITPYTGAGAYSCDLTKVPVLRDGNPHQIGVVLVVSGTFSPVSATVAVTLPFVAPVAVLPPAPVPVTAVASAVAVAATAVPTI